MKTQMSIENEQAIRDLSEEQLEEYHYDLTHLLRNAQLVWNKPNNDDGTDGGTVKERASLHSIWGRLDVYDDAAQIMDDWYEYDDPTCNGCWYEMPSKKADRELASLLREIHAD